MAYRFAVWFFMAVMIGSVAVVAVAGKAHPVLGWVGVGVMSLAAAGELFVVGYAYAKWWADN
ncbi:MAG TPA: hypothetical protein VMD53_15715 [Rhizomicrobium sp.]|nr:hypothetical protein [Rhizomicrobium sp.]